ncbi:MAG: glycine--tRNA ligase subunit beta, partial [Gammaproteobacteria bacterium]|nr:glycine--tRNA ligase subunit beta [Gammaproteobacteria bacterium]
YLLDRLRAYYLDQEHNAFTPQMFDAVAVRRPSSPLDFHQRMLAVQEFAGLEAATSLAAANKRIANILRTAKDDIPQQPEANVLTEPAEQDLFAQLTAARRDVAPLVDQRDYRAALTRLAELRPVVDRFFDDVMVMAEDETVRRNRLALLDQLRNLFMHTADLSRLQAG